jgi:hypothetical protein
MISLIKQFAASSGVKIPGNQCNGSCSDTGLPGSTVTNGTISNLLQIAFGIIGAVAVLYIVIAALQLITSGGNPESAKKARETIIYAVIGLIVAVSAEAIVTFFLNNL